MRRPLVFLLAVAFLLPALGVSTAVADDGKAALGFVPKDTMMVVAIDVNSLKKTDIFKDFMKAVTSEPEAQQNLKMLKDATGFDPERDLESIVIALPPDVDETENFLFIAKGKLDSKKFIGFAKEQGGAITEATHQGVNFYEIDKEAAMAFVGDHILLGPKAALKAAIDTNKGSMASVKKNKSVNGMIKAVNTKSNLWLAVSLPEKIRKEMAKENPMAGDISSAHASLDLASGLSVRATLTMTKADSAQALATLVTTSLAGVGNDPQLKAMGLDTAITKLKVANSGNDLTVSLDLTDKEFEKIKAMVQGLVQGSMR